MSKIYQIKLGEKILQIDTTPLAENANGSVFAKIGETMVLATCVISKDIIEGQDFFPLTVDYEERYYAAGKILGSRFLRRESKPTDEAILISRLIDRAIRPLFPKDLKNEVQIVVTCLTFDGENDPATLGLLAASTALSISDIPWNGPLGAIRIGKLNNNLLIFPDYKARESGKIDMALAGVEEENDILINMIESQSKEIKEEEVANIINISKQYLKQIIDFQKEIQEQEGKEKIKIEIPKFDQEIAKEVKDFLKNKIEKIIFEPKETAETIGTYSGPYAKEEGYSIEISDLKKELIELLKKYNDFQKVNFGLNFFEEEIKKTLTDYILDKNIRPDGRKPEEIRPITAKCGLLPRTHGSGLFSRGKTRTLSILTLGAPGDQRILEGMEIRGEKRFFHHYNFPPYCSGEVKPIRGPGRREIGHGMLAERAITQIIPTFEKFPYTIRIVSEVLSSNGSTSMASICSSCLALMDAGVPIEKPIAGISIGLIGGKVLTDIQGPEDHYGDMDFKIAGTKDGICAIQMDVKNRGINEKTIGEALNQGKIARQIILKKITETIASPRPELSPFAPRVFTLQIKPEKIRDVIGPGGKIINEIIEECGVSIDIEEDGKVFVTAEKEEAAKKAVSWIKNITREIKVGEIFQGKVKRILDFGAIIEIFPGQEGLVHISELAPFRVRKVEDVVKVGDLIPVKVIAIDPQGRISLSLKKAKNKNNI